MSVYISHCLECNVEIIDENMQCTDLYNEDYVEYCQQCKTDD